MPEDHVAPKITHPSAKPWYRQQLVFFIVGSVCIALMLVALSLAMYASSGAAQLDASRPGLVSVRDKVENVSSFQSFPADGQVNKAALDQFQKLYDKQTKLVQGEAFSASALDDTALGIDAPPVGE